MKKMRKIFAVLLTLAMVLAMSIPTFADRSYRTQLLLDSSKSYSNRFMHSQEEDN